MKCVIAIDSFKGCLTSTDAALAVAEGIRKVQPSAEILQMMEERGCLQHSSLLFMESVLPYLFTIR